MLRPPINIPPRAPAEPPPDGPPAFGAMLGAGAKTPQYGLIGTCADGRTLRVALDLNGCNTVFMCGVQGFGKSYSLGVIAEMAAKEVPRINVLLRPHGTVLFHYHRSDTYEPEHAAAVEPNSNRGEVARLLADYGASPAGLDDVVLLTPKSKVEQRRHEYPKLRVEPLQFSSAEIGPDGWKFLLGATGNDSLYVRQIVAIMRNYRRELTVDTLRREILASDMSIPIQKLALDRLAIAEPYIDDNYEVGKLLVPGRTVIVDLRDEWMEKSEALGVFVVLFHIFGDGKIDGVRFPKLFVFDEAHKYISDGELIGEVVSMIREMRHLPATVVIASQDPLSVPRSVIELSSVLLLHRFTSPTWLKHLKSAIASLDVLDIKTMASLSPGEAMVWAQRCSDKRFTLTPQKVIIRPRFTMHGGGTRTAV